MRRILAIVVILAAATVAVLGTGAGEGDTYKVRAIFDNAVSVIPGEDVKIAGVKVGKIDSLDVTREQKAAVVLRIDQPGFRDFRDDARCQIRPQSLIGEKYVECTLTEPRPSGQARAPKLRKIEDGDGKGQHLLPLERTSSPVDLDLINNILRRPYSERLSLIISELGTAVAGRGEDLDSVIRRANPALQETDRVLKILADQNQVLADLARDSDTVLAPLARERARVASAIVQSGEVAAATAERRADLERTIRRLPTFLRELRPTMRRLGALSDQATPVLADLGAVAPSINRLVLELGPFSRAALPALRTLGEATEVGRPALLRSRPTIQDLRAFAATARPLAANASALLTSFRDTGGVERFMDYLFYQVAAINGFDAFGHYLRAALIVNLCSTYSTTPVGGCSANFEAPAGAASANQLGPEGRQQLLRNAAALSPQTREDSATAAAEPPARGAQKRRARPARVVPEIALPGRLGEALRGRVAPAAPRRPAAPAPGAGTTPEAGLFDYLLGSDG